MAPTTTTDRDVAYSVPASRMFKFLSRLRQMHGDMTILQAMIFFRIAMEPGVTQRRVWEDLDTFDSVASRGVSVLSYAGLKNASGNRTEPLHLVEVRENPADRREKLLFLTNKGRTLVEDCMKDLGMDTTGRGRKKGD